MKKFLAIIAIASFAVACNGGGEKTPAADTTVVATPDTTVAAPDTTVAAPDTTKPVVADTTKAKM